MCVYSLVFLCSVTSFLLFFFFFSSRRRHTRFDCDWSSDVCSSDLVSTTTRPDCSKPWHRPGASSTICGVKAPTAEMKASLRGASRSTTPDRKSTRLNSSHSQISYAVFCLKKKISEHGTARLGSGSALTGSEIESPTYC